ncbi:MAG: hypothetical protein N7Q72_03860 [Spiroplasma sp. Tabriz.8]|nr:hypothetical protein [Spiroplasma sp. Tabriz.8]
MLVCNKLHLDGSFIFCFLCFTCNCCLLLLLLLLLFFMFYDFCMYKLKFIVVCSLVSLMDAQRFC